MCVVLIRSHINIVLLTGGIVLEVCFSPLPMDESASNRKKKRQKKVLLLALSFSKVVVLGVICSKRVELNGLTVLCGLCRYPNPTG